MLALASIKLIDLNYLYHLLITEVKLYQILKKKYLKIISFIVID